MEAKSIKPGIVIRFELLGVIIAIIINTITAVWWASHISTTMNYMKQEIIDLRQAVKEGAASQYSGTDARRDLELRDQKIEVMQGQIADLNRKYDNLMKFRRIEVEN